jgi:hypothetical protein
LLIWCSTYGRISSLHRIAGLFLAIAGNVLNIRLWVDQQRGDETMKRFPIVLALFASVASAGCTPEMAARLRQVGAGMENGVHAGSMVPTPQQRYQRCSIYGDVITCY